MHFALDGKKYRVEWEHNQPDWDIDDAGPIFYQGGTRCYITETGAEDFPEYVGEAILHPHDKYEKETGRKLSLGDAISKLSREQRTVVWKAYFGRKTGQGTKVKVESLEPSQR